MRNLLKVSFVLLLCVVTVQNAYAEADIGFKGAGGRLSFVFPDNVDATFGFGGLVDLGTFAPNVGFGASLDMWFGSEDPVDYRDIIIGANSRYWFEVKNPKIKPYAGGGLALHFFKASSDPQTISGITIPGFDESDTKIGLDLFGGANFEVSPKVDIIADAMFRIVSDVNQFVISGGIIYWFGKGGGSSSEGASSSGP